MPTPTSRLAPSPTGSLHLGNARTFLVNWALARSRGWKLLMRMEDLDGPRIKAGAAEETLDLLSWLGLDWDEEVLTQSDDLRPYREVMVELCSKGLAFPCQLSRSEIESAASAPQEGARDTAYPSRLRPGTAGTPVPFEDDGSNYRFLVPEGELEIVDQFAPHRRFDIATSTGDFVVWTKRGTPAYQLSVVVDDLRQGVTDVVRGDDLLESAARQALLYNALGCDAPRWWHLPLVRGEDGHRLAKRHGDTRLTRYREQGTTPDRIIGLAACWCGFIEEPREMNSSMFLECFDLDRLDREPVTMQPGDDQWLCSD